MYQSAITLCSIQDARLYNYPKKSFIRKFCDRNQYGIKTAFFSDTFGAYRKNILESMGNFPDVNFGEDTFMAAKMLMHGYYIGYCAEAKVYHSHSFTLYEEYKRSKEIGRFHKENSWILDKFGKAEGEGLKFVKDQINYLRSTGNTKKILVLILRNLIKYIGYKMG